MAHKPSSTARAKANTRTKLTAREKRFVEEYQVDLKGKEAAIRAGYSARTANKIAYELLQRPVVQNTLKAAIDARSQRTQITQDRVLQELARVAFFDPRKLLRADGTPKPVNELDDDTAAALVGMDILEEWTGQGAERTQVGMTKKLKLPNKVEALSLAMKHLGMLRDRVEHSGPNGQPLPVAQVVPVFHITVAGDAKE